MQNLFVYRKRHQAYHRAGRIEDTCPHRLFRYVVGGGRKSVGYSIFYGINRFHPEDIECTNYPGTVFYDQHCYRSPFAIRDNWIAYKHTCELLIEHPEIEVIHCNTPVGGLVVFKAKVPIYIYWRYDKYVYDRWKRSVSYGFDVVLK